MNKNKALVITFSILGIGLFVLGIIMTIVSISKFDVFTYKLNTGVIFGIAFPFVGIVLVIISTIIGTMSTRSDIVDNVAKQVKDVLKNEQENKQNIKTCKYCGSKCSTDNPKCPSCGAKLD